jgi:hypothetical protein
MLIQIWEFASFLLACETVNEKIGGNDNHRLDEVLLNSNSPQTLPLGVWVLRL